MCFADHNVLQRNTRSTDSDNEEFCDSMEHLAMEEVGITFTDVCNTQKHQLSDLEMCYLCLRAFVNERITQSSLDMKSLACTKEWNLS